MCTSAYTHSVGSFPSEQRTKKHVHRIPAKKKHIKIMSTISNNTNDNQNRRPKKLIHCSDGVVEESSSDDEVDRAPESRNHESVVNEVKH